MLVAEILEMAERKDLRRTRTEGCEGAAQALLQFAAGRYGAFEGGLIQRQSAIGMARPKNIERGIHRGAPQVTLLLFGRTAGGRLPQDTKKYGLQHVFGIGRIAGDPVSGAEYQAVVGLENPAEFSRLRKYRLLTDCQLQIRLLFLNVCLGTKDGGQA